MHNALFGSKFRDYICIFKTEKSRVITKQITAQNSKTKKTYIFNELLCLHIICVAFYIITYRNSDS